ncbi:AAC(3) family N-acetyltransferase [bacterium]|nr:AAC(3) family N-acetyltransferase [bacterium]
MGENIVKKEQIIRGLERLGLNRGDMVLVHSSLSSIGYVEGGADAVIDALLEVVGKEGTVAVPNLPVIWYREESHVDYLKRQPIFDVRVTPSKVGKISEVLRARREARRSLHPSHSVAAIGKRRDWLIEGHEKCLSPCGRGSPYWKICQTKGKILLLGVGQNTNTTLHTIEEVGGAPVLTAEIFYPLVIDYEGRLITVPMRAHKANQPRDFEKMDDICKKRKIMKIGRIGKATVRLIEAGELLEIGIDILKKEPKFLFKGSF